MNEVISKEQINHLLETANWTFAKTMAKTPHSYLLRPKYHNDKEFMLLHNYIDKNGIEEKFFGRTYKYYYAGKHKYWSMKNGDNDPTAIINRCEAQLKYD